MKAAAVGEFDDEVGGGVGPGHPGRFCPNVEGCRLAAGRPQVVGSHSARNHRDPGNVGAGVELDPGPTAPGVITRLIVKKTVTISRWRHHSMPESRQARLRPVTRRRLWSSCSWPKNWPGEKPARIVTTLRQFGWRPVGAGKCAAGCAAALPLEVSRAPRRRVLPFRRGQLTDQVQHGRRTGGPAIREAAPSGAGFRSRRIRRRRACSPRVR